MTKNFYAIQDVLSEKFFAPILFDSDEVAKRWFAAYINGQDDSIQAQNSQDFTLWKVGAYDEESGAIAADKHEIVNGRAVRKER